MYIYNLLSLNTWVKIHSQIISVSSNGQNMSEQVIITWWLVVKQYDLTICCRHTCTTLASLSGECWQPTTEPYSFICLDHVLPPPTFTPSAQSPQLTTSNMPVQQHLQGKNVWSLTCKKERKKERKRKGRIIVLLKSLKFQLLQNWF